MHRVVSVATKLGRTTIITHSRLVILNLDSYELVELIRHDVMSFCVLNDSLINSLEAIGPLSHRLVDLTLLFLHLYYFFVGLASG